MVIRLLENNRLLRSLPQERQRCAEPLRRPCGVARKAKAFLCSVVTPVTTAFGVSLVLLLLVAATPPELHAQTSLGDQRVGTSSGSFLRIGVGARAVAMGGAYVAVCDDITACAWNPAGLVHVTDSQLALNYVSWPADITYSHVC